MGAPMLALGAQAASPILGAFGARAEAKSQQKQAEVNAYIGKTRAIQTDTAAREGLSAELANFRTVMAANGQRPGVGTLAVQQELRDVAGRERRVEFANRNQEASAYKMQAAAYGASARNAMLTGVTRAVPSLYDMYQLRKGSR